MVKFTCPRRRETPLYNEVDEDSFDMRQHCDFCGGLNPEVFLRRVQDGELVVPTDKNYKAYLGHGDETFYFQHLSKEQMLDFIGLFNNNKINFAQPGGFYVMPFFMKRPGT